jgi:hypothetical protein
MGGFHEVSLVPAVMPALPTASSLLAAISNALPAIATGAATVGAVVGVGAAAYGSYVAVRQLHEDYVLSLADYQVRSEMEAASRATAHRQARATAVAAGTLAAVTSQEVGEDATRQFMAERVASLCTRARLLVTTAPALVDECQALAQALAEAPEALTAHVETYQRLADTVTTALARLAESTRDAGVLVGEVAALRAEVVAGVWGAGGEEALRQDCLAQLEALEAAALQRQAPLVRQGLSLLRGRLGRELRLLAARAQARQAEMRETRDLVGDILAKLQALLGQPVLGECHAAAEGLLVRVHALLASPAADEVAELRRLTSEVDALFVTGEGRLQQLDLAAHLRQEITDVLLGMGYQVNEVAADGGPTLVTPVGEAVGVEFRLDTTGRLIAEGVALTPDGVQVDAAAQERVAVLVDGVFAALRARQVKVQERRRRHLQIGDALRPALVAAPPVITPRTATPKARTREE